MQESVPHGSGHEAGELDAEGGPAPGPRCPAARHTLPPAFPAMLASGAGVPRGSYSADHGDQRTVEAKTDGAPAQPGKNPSHAGSARCVGRLGHQPHTVFALHLGSWVDRQRTESLLCLYDVRRSKASSREHFWQAALRLPRIGGKTERNAAP